MKKLRSLVLFCTLFFSVSMLRAEYFNYIGLSEGLSQPSVMSIYQDQLGRMWFGTREGICQYDGNRVWTFKGWISNAGDDVPVWLGNEVSSIVGDSNGSIYFLIDKDLVKYDTHTEKFARFTNGGEVSALASSEGKVWYTRHDSLFYLKPEEDGRSVFLMKTNISARICCLLIMKEQIAIGTYDGVFLIDRQTQQQKLSLKGIEIYRVFEDSRKGLWIGTRMNGLYRTSEKGEIQKVPYLPGSQLGVSSEQIRDFVEDSAGNIWFGTFDGLQKYSVINGTYSLIRIPRSAGGLNHSSIFAAYRDKAGTLWIGSYYGGVNYFNPQHDSFVHYDYGRNFNSYYSYIGEMVMDKDNHLWLSTDGGGISCVDDKWNILRQFTATGKDNTIPHNNIKSVCYDVAHNCLYIGTYLGGLSRYDIGSGRFHNYYTKENVEAAETRYPDHIIYHVKMWKNRVYITAHNGFFYLDTHTQQFHKLSIPFAYYEHFDIDSEGNIYLVGWKRVLYIPVENPDSVMTIPLMQAGCKASPTRVLATHEGSYIGTLGSGLYFYNRHTKELKCYTAGRNQLLSDFCYNLSLTPSGKLLIMGDKGITCLKPDDGVSTGIDLMRNFPSTHIINGCGILLDGGKIYVGDTEGVTVFSENEFGRTSQVDRNTNFYFSELWVNNKMIVPEDGTAILPQAFPYIHALKLGNEQNNLIIHFALSDYGQRLSDKWFRYKLEGLDKEWIRTRQTALYYTNLDPGKYTLRVVSVDDNNNASSDGKEITLQIRIASPWYGTWWAWMIYVIVFVSCLSYYVYSKIAKRTLALSLEKERFEKQQIEQLNHQKLVFFTNVSHEFRTPLTLIISHIDILLQNFSLNPSVYNQIAKIRKNAQKMNNLISELLEFRKLDQNYGILEVRRQDIVTFVKEIYLSFVDYAQQRNINYEFKFPEQQSVLCWFEAHLMEKVFFNLLSNAFKYTHNKGRIIVSGDISTTEVKIHITDTGIGISEQDKNKIFDRFFQGSNREKSESLATGTGIGLALTKTIIEKHHGEITLESEVGVGSTFTVKLPRKKEAFASDAKIRFCDDLPENDIIADSMPVLPEIDDESVEEKEITEKVADKSYTLLLVEDNEELLHILKSLFDPFYNVVCAHDGKEGLSIVYENAPDLIISDIMMPEMTGTEMCLQIKNNIDLCHIPVILLTALNSTEQNIEGFNRGADDYITKPFHARLLLARANNLIRSRLLMQHQFDKKPMSEIDLAGINPLDRDLLKKAVDAIEGHIDDTEFDIPALCREVGIGRSLLYTKFKALTGMTPNNFLLNYRLKFAATLLQKYPDLPIAEVSDRSGFNAPVYFSRCFKKQYGCTPQAYRKAQGQDS